MKRFLVVVALAATLPSLASQPTGRYKTIVDKMQQLHAQFPQTTAIFSLGANEDAVDIVAMRVSLSPMSVDPSKLGHIVVSTHHGNELKAPDFTMEFLKELLQKFHSAELYRGQLADTEWTIIPVLNISGYNKNNRYEYGRDPNRDYPGPCVSGPGGSLKSISLLMQHLQSRQYVGSLTVHGYIGALTYPWGVNVPNTHTHDHNMFAAATAKAAAINRYRHGTSTDVVYPCDGAYEDYAYWKHGMWSLLLELQSGSAADIKATVPAIFTYFDAIDATPSTNHGLVEGCRPAGRLDLGIE